MGGALAAATRYRMNQKYLGDSFDIVKRFWAERLNPIAPLLAHPLFIPAGIREAFSDVVGMPVLEGDSAPAEFGLFWIPTRASRCRHLGPGRSPSLTVPFPSSSRSSGVCARGTWSASTRAMPGARTPSPSES